MDFALDLNWKENARLIGKDGRREVYVYNGIIVKEIYNHAKNNVNMQDYLNFLKINEVISKSNYASNFVKLYFKDNYIFSEIVKDFDGSISHNLGTYENKIPENFWENLKEILIFLMNNELYFYDLKPENILIKKLNSNQLIPVFIDYKWINKYYPYQINLWFKSQKEKKVLRRFERLKEKMN